MKIPFTKMQAIGNDFIVINQIDQTYNLSQAQIAKLADRHFGIGFDQLLIIEKSYNPTAFDYKYRIFNADGSEVEHCGNGARCFFEFIQHHKISSKNPITAETLNGSISLTKDDGLITVDMGTFSIGMKNEPSLFFDIFSDKKTEEIQGIYIDIGNPHIVFFVNSLKDVDAVRTGMSVQGSSLFPYSVNVGFCEIINSNEIKLVVYERGSGLTLGCGSGACAASIAAIHLKKVENSLVKVNMPGGSIYTQASADNHILLKGDASIVFEGIIDL
jgi:diaminopimelate epimerase